MPLIQSQNPLDEMITGSCLIQTRKSECIAGRLRETYIVPWKPHRFGHRLSWTVNAYGYDKDPNSLLKVIRINRWLLK
jgi:hypothetical protein